MFIIAIYTNYFTPSLDESIEGQIVTPEKFETLARQIVTAVAFAHSHGVIHRDLKPGNIMLGGDGLIKVLDFGLAQVIPQTQIGGNGSMNNTSRLSNSGLIIGTVCYMSPEQLRGEKLDYRSDIFSVGIILYELLAGKNPFNCNSQAETIASILTDQIPALDQTFSDYPKAYLNLVEKCLHKNKDARFQSATEILLELDKVETESINHSPSKKRRRFFVQTVLATVVLLAVLAGIFFYNGNSSQKTLAVLPISFENPPPDKEYLANGLTQSIIEELSDLSDLKVKSEFLTARYANKIIEPQTAGRELNADAVLTGSIIRRGGGLVLLTKLVRTSDGFLIDTSEENIGDVIELQENIAARIIGKIKSNLTDEDKKKLKKKDTESTEAKNLYMQGRFYLKRKADGDDVEKAVQDFINAKDIDQNYAEAWAGLADAYLSQSAPGVKRAITPGRAFELAKLAANKAIELDNTLPDTYNSLGLINFRYEWNWTEAERYFRTAIDRDTEFLPARLGLISVLRMTERYDEALEEAIKIKKIDPFSVTSDLQIALIYYRKHDYQKMDGILSELLQRFPDDRNVKYVRVYQFLKTERINEAVELLEPLYKSDNEDNKTLAAAPLGFAYAKTGRRDEALKIIEDIAKFRKNNYVPAQEKALVYVGLGDYEKVFENLNLSCTERFSSLPGWVNDPVVDEIKSDPRFAEIKKCVNL